MDDSQQRTPGSPIWQHFRMATQAQSLRTRNRDGVKARLNSLTPTTQKIGRAACVVASVLLVAAAVLPESAAAGPDGSSSSPAKASSQPTAKTPSTMSDPDSAPPAAAPVKRDFGFKPPPAGSFVSQALVPWVNRQTGERFTAPTGGWQPPSPDWVVDYAAEPSPSEPATRSGTSR